MAANLFRKLKNRGLGAAGLGGGGNHAGNAIDFTKSNFEQVLKDSLGPGTVMEKWDNKRKKMRNVKTKLDIDAGTVECSVIKKGIHRRRRRVVIPVISIKEVRLGQYTKSFKKMVNMGIQARVDFSFSVIHGRKFETLDLVCASQEDLSMWTTALQWIIDNISCKDEKNHFLKAAFAAADRNGNGLLDMEEVGKVRRIEGQQHARIQSVFGNNRVEALRSLNLNVSKKNVKMLCKQVDVNGDGNSVEFTEFIGLYRKLSKRQDILDLFSKYAADEYMTKEEFDTFLLEFQGTKNIPYEFTDGQISKSKFTEYVQSLSMEDCYFTTKVYQDMTQPLSAYWVNSSHNTYLLGDQLVGESSVEGYIRPLQDGCRCVEIDAWDGDDGEPVVYHGHTFTSKVRFEDVVAAIAQYAFVASMYPVIINIEDHCSPPQQTRMAAILKSKLGDMLLPGPLMELLSPAALAKKILVRSKVRGKVSNKAAANTPKTDEKDNGYKTGDDSTDEEDEQGKKKGSAGSKEYAAIVGLVNTKTNLVKGDENLPAYATTSKSESGFLKLADSHPEDMVRFIQGHMTRIYPAGSRVKSSNYDPRLYWMYGCQIVALNQQTNDEGMRWNRAMFMDNGGCGYVLMPDKLRSPGWYPRLELGKSVEPPTSKMNIKVISAHHLPFSNVKSAKDIVDPYVVIEMDSVSGEDQKQRTRHIQDNGFNPRWDESFSFNLTSRDCGFICISVMDRDTRSRDDFLCQTSMRVKNMLPGYHHVPLYTLTGQKIPLATLFVRVKFADL